MRRGLAGREVGSAFPGASLRELCRVAAVPRAWYTGSKVGGRGRGLAGPDSRVPGSRARGAGGACMASRDGPASLLRSASSGRAHLSGHLSGQRKVQKRRLPSGER